MFKISPAAEQSYSQMYPKAPLLHSPSFTSFASTKLHLEMIENTDLH